MESGEHLGLDGGHGGVTLGWMEGGTWGHPGDPRRTSRPPLSPVPATSPPQDTELASTSLRTLTEGLRDLAQRAQTLVLEGPPGGATPQPPPFALLACVVDLIGAAKGLFSWLNRSGAGRGGTRGCWAHPRAWR